MKNISSLFGGGVATNDINFKIYAENQISNFRKFNKLILIKQITIFFILKILRFNLIYRLFLKILKKSHYKTASLF